MGQRGRPRHPGLLTQREEDVLALLREGLTNEQIASRLVISFETAKHHVSQVLSKLGVATREEAAAWRPEAEAPRWTPWRIAVAIGGMAVLAAAVAGLALLAWGVSESGEVTEVDAFAVAECEAARAEWSHLDKGEQTGIGIFLSTNFVCWDDVAGEDRYFVEAREAFMADCDAPPGATADSVTTAGTVSADITYSRRPDPPSSIHNYRQTTEVSVVALDRAGNELRRGRWIVQRDDFGDRCSSPTPTAEGLKAAKF